MVIASSISGLPIYAPSAAFAPTNSADVSAIASAYQVVSSTATQLYAGTAYVTSVNEAPISAARAGNAANASMATSAYYDGTGRLISALPDSTAVSGIASAYAESAVSSKADSSALSSYALSADVSGTVDLVSTQSANWGGSALALSAGPGVMLEKVGNTLVASTDETVLFSGSSYGVSFTETLSENITNFEYLGISISNAKNRASYTVYPVSEYPTNNMSVPTLFNKDVSYPKGIGLHGMTIVFNKTSADSITCGCWLFNFNDSVGNSDSIYLTKIVGINRTAEA